MLSFKKEERLCSKKVIDLLYKSGSSFFLYPFKIQFIINPTITSNSPIQVLFIVPKKRLKKAVDRNLVKRRMREVYRCHKQTLLYAALPDSNIKIAISYLYVGNGIESFEQIENSIKKSMSQLIRNLSKPVQ